MIIWQQEQLNLLKAIPKNPFWDSFFLTFNHFDSFAFAILAIIFVWKFIDQKMGIRFFYLMTLSFFLNVIFKNFFSLPRPCQLDPSFALMCLTSFGFPSGASQSASIYFGITFLEAKKRSYIFFAFIFSFLLCFSRLYLGVHFFTDVLGGIGIGFVCLLLYKYAFAKFEKFSFPFAIIFAFLMLLINPSVFYSSSVLILSIVFTQKLIEKKEAIAYFFT